MVFLSLTPIGGSSSSLLFFLDTEMQPERLMNADIAYLSLGFLRIKYAFSRREYRSTNNGKAII